MPPVTTAPARLRLLTGPAGSGKTHRALAGIRAAATSPDPVRAGARALLILPTYAQVMHVKRLALSRWDVRGILDEPFTTFTAAGERFLTGFRVRTLPSPEERDRLMAEALRRAAVPTFLDVADRPGFRARLLRLVKELKQTGGTADEARERLVAGRDAVGEAARERLDAFLHVFQAYEDLLERAGLEDHEDALRRLALRLRDAPPSHPPTFLAVDGFDDFTRVEEQIVHTLAERVAAAGGEVVVTLPWDEARPTLFAASAGPRMRLRECGFVEERLADCPRTRSAPLVRIAQTLFGPADRALDGGEAVQALLAGDAEDEAETIARTLRRVVTGGDVQGVRGWRDVGIVVRRLDEGAARLRAACERVGVPLRVVGQGEVLASEPLVRALRGPLGVLAGRVEAGRFDARASTEWLHWRALATGLPLDDEAVDGWAWAQRAYGPPADWDAYRAAAPAALEPVLAGLDAQARGLARLRGAATVYPALREALVASAPLPSPGGFDARGRPLDAAGDRRLARAAAARARLVGIVDGLGVAAQRTGLGADVTAAEAVREVLDACEEVTLALPDRRLDAVSLMDAEEARFWELPLVVVAGLVEGSFPLRPREDVLLRDEDRAALARRDETLRLPLARDREARERRLFYGALTRARTRLYVSRAAFDEKGEPRAGSFFLRDLERVVTPTVAAQAGAPGRTAREREECFTPADWRLFAASRLGVWARQRAGDVAAADRALAAAIHVVSGSAAHVRAARSTRREADALWPGGGTRAVVLAHFAAQVATLSVSRLNHAVLCPHRFFLGCVLGIPQDDLSLDGPVFDAREEGRALHHAFEQSLRRPDADEATLAREAVEHVGARGMDARLLEPELARAVRLLRAREAACAGPLRPWPPGLELDFRRERAVELGEADARFRLGGLIDRVDRAGDAAVIVDYKRSRVAAETSFKAARDGQDLQLPLYARVLELSTGMTVVGLEWVAGLVRHRRIVHDAEAAALFENRREGGAVLAEAGEAFRARLAGAESLASACVRAARAGEHARQPREPTTCARCPWSAVCRPDTAWLGAQDAATDEGEDA